MDKGYMTFSDFRTQQTPSSKFNSTLRKYQHLLRERSPYVEGLQRKLGYSGMTDARGLIYNDQSALNKAENRKPTSLDEDLMRRSACEFHEARNVQRNSLEHSKRSLDTQN